MEKRRESRTGRMNRQLSRKRARRLKTGRQSNDLLAIMQRFLLKNLTKKKVVFAAVVLGLSLSVPFMFATAANSNEVEQIAKVNAQASVIASQPDSSTQTPSPVATGELVSELTDDAVQPTASAPASPSPPADPIDPGAANAELQNAFSVISSGMNDPFVAMIQQRLMDLNYMDQDDPTTVFGPITSQAISEFQRKNGLPQDGIAGVQTQTVLFSNDAKPYVVTQGDSGPDVQNLQDRLADLGYTVEDTGYFGTDTTKAVQYFQRMNGLTADGNVGDDTRQAIYSQNAEPSAEFTAAKKAASQKPSPSSSSGTGNKSSSSSAGNTSGNTAPTTPAAPANTSKVEAFINAALAELGKTYVLGGKGPNVFDCSGLVYYALKASGNGIPYMTSYGWGGASQYARINSMKDLQRGDVVCERGHVGIYLGNGQIVNASSSNGKIIISDNVFSSSYWVGHFVCGRRPL